MENDVLYNRVMNVVHEEYAPPGEGTKEITITENGTTTEDVRSYAYAEITAAVPNSYTESDEGKVVDNGALVSQTSATYTENDTYDTTLIDEVIVNVSGGGGIGVEDFFKKTEPSGAITTDMQGEFATYCAYGRKYITSLSAPNATAVREYAFYGCSGLISASLPLVTQIDGSAFRGCTALTSFNAKNVHRVYGNAFYSTEIPEIVFPSITQEAGSYVFASWNGQKADLGGSSLQIKASAFQSASNFTTLILRRTTVVPLANINAFNSTPFASNGTGGTLYVPQALVSSYQSATNWSTILGYANNSIQAIEGSIYETQYADGTAIPTP